MISFWKIAKIRRLFDSEPNVTHCAKECHVDPKSVRKFVDKNVAPATKKPREQPTRTAPLDEFWPEIKTLLENDPKLKPNRRPKQPWNHKHNQRPSQNPPKTSREIQLSLKWKSRCRRTPNTTIRRQLRIFGIN